jgi:ribonuclease-3 family protein
MEQLMQSGRTLAFLGDAVWSLVVRDYLIRNGEGLGKNLQSKSISYVSAKSQARFYEMLHERGFFTEEEEELYHRGRNSNSGTAPRNTNVITYRMSTGFEALIGGLYLEQKWDRIQQIWEEVRTA